MNEETSPSPVYIKGFNEGYLLGTHEPELSKSLSVTEGAGDRLNGIKDGIAEAALEKSRDKFRVSFSPKSVSDKDKEVSPEKGDLDREEIDKD